MTKLSHQTSDSEEGSKKRSPQQISLLGRAIRYLSNREHSQEELIRKLSPHAESQEELERVLKQLQEKGLQSNTRFAESLVRRKSERYGHRRVSEELKRNKIDSEVTSQLIGQMRLTELDRAREIWDKKYGVVATDPKEMARQARFLAGKGFDADVVLKIIRGRLS
jgi:regulatory protein